MESVIIIKAPRLKNEKNNESNENLTETKRVKKLRTKVTGYNKELFE